MLDLIGWILSYCAHVIETLWHNFVWVLAYLALVWIAAS